MFSFAFPGQCVKEFSCSKTFDIAVIVVVSLLKEHISALFSVTRRRPEFKMLLTLVTRKHYWVRMARSTYNFECFFVPSFLLNFAFAFQVAEQFAQIKLLLTKVMHEQGT